MVAPLSSHIAALQAATDGAAVHASCVALGGQGALIFGPAGSGKSTLALELMAMGAALVSDDRTILRARPEGPPLASAPAPLSGLIEARGVGLLCADPAPPSSLAVLIDMGSTEKQRLPPLRRMLVLGAELPVLHKAEMPGFAAAVLQYLKGGRQAP